MDKGLLFSTSTELVRVPESAVVYIMADGNYSAIFLADGSHYVLTLQLGKVAQYIAEVISERDNRFIRIGKSMIVNRDFITYIHVPRQRLALSDGRTFRHNVTASRDALKALKQYIEQEAVNE